MTASFFDEQHESDQLPLPLLFRALRRFEVARTTVAAALLPPGGRLLDLGCGEGELAALVGGRYERLVATDVSPAAVARATQRCAAAPFAARIELRVLDGNQPLPFAAGSFDSVVSLSTLQYIFDPEQLLREVHRVLAPGGTVLVEVPNMAYLPQRLRLLSGRPIRTSFWKHGIDGGNLHYFTLDSLRELLAKAGFRARRHAGSGIFAAARAVRPSLLSGNLFVLATKV